MSDKERRQHFRINDQIYFNYYIVHSSDLNTEQAIIKELLGESGLRHMEAIRHFRDLDKELTGLASQFAVKEPAIAQYLDRLNGKIDYLARQILMKHLTVTHHVNISLGGMAFKTPHQIAEATRIKMVIYTKPQLLPIILDTAVVYSQFQPEGHYRTAVIFDKLTPEQERLLSQHIMQAEGKPRAV